MHMAVPVVLLGRVVSAALKVDIVVSRAVTLSGALIILSEVVMIMKSEVTSDVCVEESTVGQNIFRDLLCL